MVHDSITPDSRAGFSLLELLIYIAILSLITLVIGNAFVSFNRSRGQVEARSEVNTALRFAIEKMAQDIHAASSATTPATAGATSSTLVLSVSGTTVSYCVVNSQLLRDTSGGCSGSGEAMTSTTVTVATPTFTRIENTNTVLSKTFVSIEINLTASYNTSNPDWQYTESKKTTVALR